MPARIPISFIWSKFFEIMVKSTIKTLSLTLYVLCVLIQVPLYWKFAGRVYTWAIDGQLPDSNPNFLDALLFGEYNLGDYINQNNLSPFDIAKYKLFKFISYTYFSGVRYIVIAILIHVALFVEHEWVVRDEGYIKLFLKKVGKEPRQQLVDMLQQAVLGMRNNGAEGDETTDENLRRIDLIANAVNEIHDEAGNRNREILLRRAIEQGLNYDGHLNENRDINVRDVNVDDTNNNDNNDDTNNNNVDDNINENAMHEPQQPAQPNNPMVHPPIGHPQDEAFDEEIERNDENRDLNFQIRNEHIQPTINNINQVEVDSDEDRDLEMEEEFAQRNEDIDAAAIAGNNGGVAEFFELFGFTLNLKAPIFIMLLCDIVISAYLFIVYLIPHMLGNLVVSLVSMILKFFNAYIFSDIFSYKLLKWNFILKKISNEIEPSANLWTRFIEHFNPSKEIPNFLETSYNSIIQFVVSPSISIFKNLFIETKTPYSLLERVIILLVGYGVIIYAIYRFMKSLVAGTKPILGTPRKIYRILFEISTTGKVFLIFAIEIFFFPVYCGFLLDFCLAPLHLDLLTKDINGIKTYLLLLTPNDETFQHPLFTILIYWIRGTGYMLFFALFVGMVRTKILRPGVLFFIRSPDDPNANLIHDALVKPLMLQLSRIYLSAKVYTGFILVGIGGVTWSLRGFIYLTNPSKEYNVLLPIQWRTLSTCILVGLVISRVSSMMPLLSNYNRQYWTKVFEISCHKLRLSHFIIGRPIHQERGYIVYRSIFHSLLGIGVPDFTRPVTYREAMIVFKENPEVTAVFVPNGNYVRAPDKDTVSRKYIKKLFVLVTKDDKLLSKNELKVNKSGYETPTSEEEDEINADNGYMIVYRPPNFKLRCFGLILLLWVFSIILIMTILMAAIILGRPLVSAFTVLQQNFSYISILLPFVPDDMNWRLIDFESILIGVLLELLILYIVDEKLNARSGGTGANEVNPQAPQQQQQQQQDLGLERVRDFARIFLAGNFIIVAVALLSWFLWTGWIITVHILCIDYPLRMFTNSFEGASSLIEHMKGPFRATLLTTPFSLVLHFFAGLWTIVPSFYYIMLAMNGLNQAPAQLPWTFGLYPALINFGMLHIPATLMIAIIYYFDIKSLESVYIWPVTLILVLIMKSAYSIRNLFTKINDQVKNEKYVKGRAIENVDVDDKMDN